MKFAPPSISILNPRIFLCPIFLFQRSFIYGQIVHSLAFSNGKLPLEWPKKMKTRLIVVYAGTVQVSEIINGMTQSWLIVFHVRQTQKLDLLNKNVEWTQDQRLEDKD